MRDRRLLRALMVAIVAGGAVAACSSMGGGGGGDAGPDGGDAAPDDVAAQDASGAASDSAEGEEAGPMDSGEEASDASGALDSGADAGPPGLLYAGAVVDLDVDAVNLYMLLPSNTTLASCPLAGCGAGGPTTLRAGSRATELEASAGVIYFGYNDALAHVVNVGSINADGTGFAESPAYVYGGPGTVQFRTLRFDESFLYGSIRRQVNTQLTWLSMFRILPGAVGDPNPPGGGPTFDVRGRYKVEYFPGGNPGPPESFSSHDKVLAVSASYPIPPTNKPKAVAVNGSLVAMLDTLDAPSFCPRIGCVAWTVANVVAHAIAMDAEHLYLGTSTDVQRCAVAEMQNLGTCTPAKVGDTGGSVAQLVLKNGKVYARTSTPAVVALDLSALPP